jgi:hypothetical protein
VFRSFTNTFFTDRPLRLRSMAAAEPLTRLKETPTRERCVSLGAERAQRAVRRTRVVLAAATALVGALLLVGSALADAAPVELVLVYMPNVSNTDTKNATGIAELVMSEGEVRIHAADLPRLDGDKQYVAWVVNSHTDEFQKLGAFNTAASTGAVEFENVLDNEIPDKSWNLLLITQESSADADHPSNRHSIAGTFPKSGDAALPGILPNTGGAEDAPMTRNPISMLQHHASLLSKSEWVTLAVPGALVAAATFAAGFGLGLKRR